VADQARARRLAVRIREIVASTLENQVKDPRLGMVTITDARLTPDLRDATLYYTVYGDETARAESAAALESARGVLRTQVGRQTGVKFTPTLAFVADAVPEHAAQIDELLAVARAADAELAHVREGKTYAGDPDPYRHDEDEDADGPADPTGPAAGADRPAAPAAAGDGADRPAAATPAGLDPAARGGQAAEL
jgi:ribosome-binding factor A